MRSTRSWACRASRRLSLLATVVAESIGLDGAVAALDAVGGTLFVLIPIAFLAGLLRLRLHRAREADLAVERLQAQLRAQLVEVRASRARIVEAGDAERSRSSVTCTTARSSACWVSAWPCERPGTGSQMAAPIASTSS